MCTVNQEDLLLLKVSPLSCENSKIAIKLPSMYPFLQIFLCLFLSFNHNNSFITFIIKIQFISYTKTPIKQYPIFRFVKCLLQIAGSHFDFNHFSVSIILFIFNMFVEVYILFTVCNCTLILVLFCSLYTFKDSRNIVETPNRYSS